MATGQLIAILSALAIFLVNAALAMLLTRFYLKDRSISSLIWGAGMRFFAIAALLELLFAFGVYSGFLAKVYLFAIAMPLLIFSIGHMQFAKSKKVKQYYYYYCIVIAFAFLYIVSTANFGSIFQQYAVYGAMPIAVTALSLLIGISACIVLAAVAIGYYSVKRKWRMLAVIPGAALFLLNNALHLAALSPALLYYYQLLGIMLLWLGFVGFAGVKEYPQA